MTDNIPGARDIATPDGIVWFHCCCTVSLQHERQAHRRRTDDDSIGPFPAPAAWREAVRCMGKSDATSLILYAEHEFMHRPSPARSSPDRFRHPFRHYRRDRRIAGPNTAVRMKPRSKSRSVYDNPDEAEADIRTRVQNKEVVIGFGHPVYTVSDPRNEVIKEVARTLSAQAGSSAMFDIAERLETVMWDIRRCSRTWTGSRPCRIT